MIVGHKSEDLRQWALHKYLAGKQWYLQMKDLIPNFVHLHLTQDIKI